MNSLAHLKMKNGIVSVLFFAPLLMMFGCASNYNDYECGMVSSEYCPPKPLPHSNFGSCRCSDSLGDIYLTNLTAANQSTATTRNHPQSIESSNRPQMNVDSSRRVEFQTENPAVSQQKQ